MREYDDRVLAVRPFRSFQAIRAGHCQRTHTARLQIHHVDEADEVASLVVEAVPPIPFDPLAYARDRASRHRENIVLARYVEDAGQRAPLST